ncbi:RidA family protein [Pseudomonas sp. NPDC090203]|jgi:enamine deaminase RidA (YjgF/YER057c/UK114 family)|uniref:RidA family protein n=1 Tax=Pseudomonas TaxID=286 RepID=UPI002363AC90|nr:RidA family protein [Pseudomonas putida]MDD1966297.1 RidA family protein [Pseudomonas putida]
MSVQRQLTNERMSQVVIHNGTVYLAGQVANDMTGNIEQQTREVLGNIERLLDLAGTDKSRLLSVTIYLNDIGSHFATMNGIWDTWLAKGFAPARATVEAKMAAPDVLIEMSVVAALP